MTTAIAKAVQSELLDLWGRTKYVKDVLTNVGPAVGFGDTLDIPYEAAPTSTSSTTRAAPASVTPSADVLSVDQEIFFNEALPRLLKPQYLNGQWPREKARRLAGHASNDMDDNVCAYLAKVLAWDTSGTYHVNAAGAALTDDMVSDIEARALDQDGISHSDLIWVVTSYGQSALKKIADYVPGFSGSEAGRLGVPPVASVNGIQVLQTKAAPRNITVDTTAVVVTSNVAVATVAAGHGVVPGMLVTTSGLTTNVTTATAVTAVSATTITFALTDCDGALADGVGTISCQTSLNMLLVKPWCFFAQQEMASVEAVKDYESAATALQIYAAYGRKGHAGGAWVLHTDD